MDSYAEKCFENLSEYDKKCFKMAEFFIRNYFTYAKTYEKEHTSYGLKHQCEHFFQACKHIGINFDFENTCYVSNEAFKAAMKSLCYTGKPEYKGSVNEVYKYKYIGPKLWNGFRYHTPMTEDDWRKVLDVHYNCR